VEESRVMITWNETRGQDANTYDAEHESGARMFVFYWHDGYAEASFNFDGARRWNGVYTKPMKTPLEQVQAEVVRAVEDFLK
jgi:hypothetical protein